MLMSNMKTAGVFVIIFGCFAVLYPKIFHPMVVQIFGLSKEREKTGADMPRHPREVNPNKPMPNPPRNPTMRPGVHPGMRAAAEMRKQAGDQGGGNKGMINMVLPMYAVGIVIYLVYTMAKVFMRTKKADEPGPFQARSDYQYQRSSSYQEDAGPYFNYPTDMDDETRFLLSKREKLEELEELLAKAELKQINDNEMVTLRERLEETESQMSRILKAMEHVQSRVKDGIDAHLEARGHRQPREDDIKVKKASPNQAGPAPETLTPETTDSGKPASTNAGKPQPAATGTGKPTDLNALDSESSGRESDDELSDGDEIEDDNGDEDEREQMSDEDEDDEEEEDDEEDDEGDDGDEEESEDDMISDEEKGVTEINGIGRLNMNSTDGVIKNLARQFDVVPDSDPDSEDVVVDGIVGSVDVNTDEEIEDMVASLGASRLFGGDDSDVTAAGLRQRKTAT